MITLILLPGMDGTGTLFAGFETALTAAVAGGIDIVRVAYPVDGTEGYADLQSRVRALLPHDRPYIMLAESFSGPIAIAIAATRPEGLRGLILCATFAACPLPVPRWLAALLTRLPVKRVPIGVLGLFLFGRHTEMKAGLKAALAPVSVRALAARARAVATADYRAELAGIEVPTLYLHATEDRLVPASAMRTIRNGLSDVRVINIDAPHFLLQVASDEAAHAVARFLQEVTAAERPGAIPERPAPLPEPVQGLIGKAGFEIRP